MSLERVCSSFIPVSVFSIFSLEKKNFEASRKLILLVMCVLVPRSIF